MTSPSIDTVDSARRRSRGTAPTTPADFGTLAWALATDGRMTRGEQFAEFTSAVGVVASMLPAQVRQRLGLRNRKARHVELADIAIPDSAVAREAEELCRESSPNYFLTHSARTYIWGMMLGLGDGIRPDAEMLYVASMLHDLALTDRFRNYHPMPCFAARAGIHACDWAADRGWDSRRCATLGDAITLHLNSKVSSKLGAEARLLQAGAGLDIIGLRCWELTPGTMAAVIQEYPRFGLKSSYDRFKAEASPRTRTQLLSRWLLFKQFVRFAPFTD